MPVYEYKCEDCGEEFEILVPISKRDKPGICCPACNSGKIARKLSLVAPSKSDSTCSTCATGTCPTCNLG